VTQAKRLNDAQMVGALDEAFHATLLRAAGNGDMNSVHTDVTERIRIIRRLDFSQSDRIDATYAEHGKILRTVLQRRFEQAQSTGPSSPSASAASRTPAPTAKPSSLSTTTSTATAALAT